MLDLVQPGVARRRLRRFGGQAERDEAGRERYPTCRRFLCSRCLLHNQKVRNVIDTITSEAVLILGRFTDERKAVLDALRGELRKRNYLPILFGAKRTSSEGLTSAKRTSAPGGR